MEKYGEHPDALVLDGGERGSDNWTVTKNVNFLTLEQIQLFKFCEKVDIVTLPFHAS